MKRPSLFEEFSANQITIVTSCVVLAGAVTLRAILPPYVSLGPLFLFGCAIPAAVISRRWGTFAAILCSVTVSLLKVYLSPGPFHADVFFWDVIMRFVFFEIYVLLFDYVRRQSSVSSGTDR